MLQSRTVGNDSGELLLILRGGDHGVDGEEADCEHGGLAELPWNASGFLLVIPVGE